MRTHRRSFITLLVVSFTALACADESPRPSGADARFVGSGGSGGSEPPAPAGSGGSSRGGTGGVGDSLPSTGGSAGAGGSTLAAPTGPHLPAVGERLVYALPLTTSLTYGPEVYCHPAPTTAAVLELRNDAGSIEAAVTFAFDAEVTMDAVLTTTTLTLTGAVWDAPTVPSESSSATSWASFVIDVAPNGALGKVAATGTYSAFDGGDGACETTPIVGAGTIRTDTIAPQVLVGRKPRGGPNQMLPWDALTLTVSTPVDADVLTAAFSVSTNGASIAGSSIVATPNDWAGATTATLVAPWDAIRGAGKLDVAAFGLSDVGGAAVTGAASTIFVLDPGAVVADQPFDVATGYGLFGTANQTSDGAVCESGGCVDLGTVDVACPPPTTGVALRVGAPSGSTVHARVRFDAPMLAYTPGVSIILSTPPLPGTTMTTSSVSGGAAMDPPSPAWFDLDAPLPAGWSSEDVGVVVMPGTGSPVPDCIVYTETVPRPDHVVVDRVWSD